MQTCYLLCGAPGSGKTWVSEQLLDKFNYVIHDQHEIDLYPKAILQACQISDKPVIGNAPFRASVIQNYLVKNGVEVKMIYVIEPYDVIAQRFIAREGIKKFSNWHKAQIKHMEKRSKEIADYVGTSQQVLDYMRAI